MQGCDEAHDGVMDRNKENFHYKRKQAYLVWTAGDDVGGVGMCLRKGRGAEDWCYRWEDGHPVGKSVSKVTVPTVGDEGCAR